MPNPVRGLPFGRPPTQSPQNQFLDERRRSVPEPVRDWVASVPPYMVGPTVITLTANTLYLTPVPYLVFPTVVDTVRVNVTTGSAGTTARAGLYLYDGARKDKKYTLVPGSEAVFDTASTGVKDVDLPVELVLSPGAIYLIGFKCTSATPAFSAVANRLRDRFTYANQSGSMPKTLDKSQETIDQTGFAGVVYYATDTL